MKEASGELNMTLVTIIAIVAIAGIFLVFKDRIWEAIESKWDSGINNAGDVRRVN